MSTQETYLKGIADAIRSKTGTTGTIKASQFASKISSIETGVAKPTWKTMSLPTSAKWSSVTYGGGKFVAVASDTNIAAYSTDGINWTQTTMPMSAKWSAVASNGTTFMAVAKNNSIFAMSGNGSYWYTPSITLQTSASWADVGYSTDAYIILGGNSNSIGVYVPANNTTHITSLPVTANWTGFASNQQGRCVAVASGTNIAAYSNGDVASWTQTTMPTSANWSAVTYGNGKFVATTNSSDVAAYSTDGITWTQTTLPVSASWYGLTYANGKFVAMAYANNYVAYSTDGITWTLTTTPATFLRSVVYGDGKFVSVPSDNQYIGLYIKDSFDSWG